MEKERISLAPAERKVRFHPPWPQDRLHELVLAEVERIWKASTAPGWFGWMSQKLSGELTPRGIYVCEYEDADWDRAQCQGKCAGAWLYDDYGPTPLAEDEGEDQFDEQQGRWYAYPRFKFAVDAEGLRVTIIYLWGDRAGYGGVYRSTGERGGLTMGEPRWIS